MSVSGNPEKDQILVPTSGGYKSFPLLNLLGISDRQIRGVRNFGLPPLHFIEQRGPQQDGSTPLDIRLDPRTIQVLIERGFCNRFDFWDARNELLDLLRPTRAFGNGSTQPLIYRKWLPAGKTEYGSDGVSNGATTFTSVYGRFITRGGLRPNDAINISGTAYTITDVPNDYTLTLSSAPGAATGLQWNYTRRHAKRDLYCLLERGPTFDEYDGPQPSYPTGYREALRFRAHDPAWYGPEQSQSWTIPDDIGDLVFDGDGAWFGATEYSRGGSGAAILPQPGTGRWLFAVDGVIETVGVIYWGTDRAKPIIEIIGPADSFSITNTTTGVSISYNNTIAAGVTVTIDLLALTITDNFGTNLLQFSDGDLSLFGLEGEPQAPNRVNNISVNIAGGAAGTSQAIIKWRNRFIGI